MTDAHRLTAPDAALLRRRRRRGPIGADTVVVSLVLFVYAAVTAGDGPLTTTIPASVVGWLGMGLFGCALVLAFAAPRTGAACAIGWALSLAVCALLPGADGLIGPGAGSFWFATACAGILAGLMAIVHRVVRRQRALVRSWQTPETPAAVPAVDERTRRRLLRVRPGRVVLGCLLAVATLVFAGATVADVLDTQESRRGARTVTTTVDRVDANGVSWVVIGGERYGLWSSATEPDQVGDTVRVRYNESDGFAEDADAPYDAGGSIILVGGVAPATIWLLGAEVIRRRGARRLLKTGGSAVWAFALVEPDGRLRVDAEPGATLGVWGRLVAGSLSLGASPVAYRPEPAPGPAADASEPKLSLVVLGGPNLDLVAVRAADDDGSWTVWRDRRRLGRHHPRSLSEQSLGEQAFGEPPLDEHASGAAVAACEPPARQDWIGTPTQDTPMREEDDGSAEDDELASSSELAAPASAGATDEPPRGAPWAVLLVPVAAVAVAAGDTWLVAVLVLWLVLVPFVQARRTPQLDPGEEGLRVRGPILTRVIPWTAIAQVRSLGDRIEVDLRRLDGSAQARAIVIAANDRRDLAPGCRTAAQAAALIERHRHRAPLLTRPITVRVSKPALLATITVLAAAIGTLIGTILWGAGAAGFVSSG